MHPLQYTVSGLTVQLTDVPKWPRQTRYLALAYALRPKGRLCREAAQKPISDRLPPSDVGRLPPSSLVLEERGTACAISVTDVRRRCRRQQGHRHRDLQAKRQKNTLVFVPDQGGGEGGSRALAGALSAN